MTNIRAELPVSANKVLLAGPLYLQVAEHMRSRVGTGEWSPQHPLPNEGELAQAYGVSVGTMRKALETLVHQKLLVRYQGRGTFVISKSRRPESRLWPFSLNTELRDDDHCESTRVSALSLESGSATPQEAAVLLEMRGAGVERLSLYTQIGELAVSHDVLVVISESCPRLAAEWQEQPGRLPGAAIELLSQIVECKDRVLPAVASNCDAGVLRIQEGHPVLSIERHAIDDNGKVILVINRRVAVRGGARYSLRLL